MAALATLGIEMNFDTAILAQSLDPPLELMAIHQPYRRTQLCDFKS